MTQIINKKNKVSKILYSEDFGAAPVDLTSDDKDTPVVTAPEEVFLLDQKEAEEAYQKGLQEGRKLEKEIWNKEKSCLENKYKNEIVKSLENVLFDIQSNRDALSKELSAIFFRILLNVFPEILKKYGVEESRKTICNVSRFISDKYQIELTCSKDLYENIEEFLSSALKDKVRIIENDTITGGDFKIVWDKGLFSRSANKIISEMEAEIFSISHKEK